MVEVQWRAKKRDITATVCNFSHSLIVRPPVQDEKNRREAKKIQDRIAYRKRVERKRKKDNTALTPEWVLLQNKIIPS